MLYITQWRDALFVFYNSLKETIKHKQNHKLIDWLMLVIELGIEPLDKGYNASCQGEGERP